MLRSVGAITRMGSPWGCAYDFCTCCASMMIESVISSNAVDSILREWARGMCAGGSIQSERNLPLPRSWSRFTGCIARWALTFNNTERGGMLSSAGSWARDLHRQIAQVPEGTKVKLVVEEK